MDASAFHRLHASLVASGMDPTEAAAVALRRMATTRMRNTQEAEETYARETEKWKRAENLVPTLAGPIAKEKLGITVFREHLMHQIDVGSSAKPDPVEISRLANMKRSPFDFLENVVIGPSDAEAELCNYLRSGGRTMVEVTPVGRCVEEHLKTLKSMLGESKVVVVRGVGVDVDTIGRETGLVETLVKELSPPCGAGIIGEIVLSRSDATRNATILRACAEAQIRVGGEVPILIVVDTMEQVKETLRQVFRTSKKIVFAGPGILSSFRPDRTAAVSALLDEWGERVSLCVDVHGSEIVRRNSDRKEVLPSIEEIARSVARLLQQNKAYASRIVFGHAHRFKTQLARYGGFGCARVLEDLVPRLRRLPGISEMSLRCMLVDNPANLLASYRPPKPKRTHVTSWRCAQCARLFDDADEQFTRMSFVYCSIECLQAHRKGKRAFDDEMQTKRAREKDGEDEDGGGGRGPAGVWGVCV